MSLSAPTPRSISGAAFRVGIAAARFNEEHVDALLEAVVGHLRGSGVKAASIEVERVPGSYELPSALQLMSSRRRFDVMIALGVLIRGDTIHYELIADSTTQALHRVSLDAKTPVINGVVVAETRKQADDRCFGKVPRGAEFGQTALEMAALKRRLTKS